MNTLNPPKLSFVARIKMEESIIDLTDLIPKEKGCVVKNVCLSRIKEGSEICFQWKITFRYKFDSSITKSMTISYNKNCSRKVEIKHPFALNPIITEQQLKKLSEDTGIDWTSATQATSLEKEGR